MRVHTVKLLVNITLYYIMSPSIPQDASAAVLQPSAPIADDAVSVQGPNFDEHQTLDALLSSYERIGFQATSLGRAINIVNKMVGYAGTNI
jgi:deoxyhypusine synthase